MTVEDTYKFIAYLDAQMVKESIKELWLFSGAYQKYSLGDYTKEQLSKMKKKVRANTVSEDVKAVKFASTFVSVKAPGGGKNG